MSEKADRAVAISKLTELAEHQGLRAYVVGYLSAFLDTRDLETAVDSATGYWEARAAMNPFLELAAEIRAGDSPE